MAFFLAWETCREIERHSVPVTLSLHLRDRVGFVVVVVGGCGNKLVSLLVGIGVNIGGEIDTLILAGREFIWRVTHIIRTTRSCCCSRSMFGEWSISFVDDCFFVNDGGGRPRSCCVLCAVCDALRLSDDNCC